VNELFENKKALINPHQLLIKYKVPKDKVPEGSGVLKERNPLIYAMVTEALARLQQIKAGLNYLGYCDSFIPPWRFQFLLGRARYFAEHAKSLQSEYINFLSNAEREEYQEMLAEQNVVMEKGNIYIESARVNQNVLAVEASKQSKELSELIKEDSAKRVDAFKHFDEQARKHTEKILHGSKVSLLGGIISGGISGGEAGARGGGWAGAALGAITGAFLGGLQGYGQSESLEAQMAMQTCQREYELINLGLAEKEAGKAAKVAVDQLAVANAALVVSQLQRTAAIFRHENAVHNLYFMRGRNLNQEKWYRLVQTMYTLSRNYMRYAVELAFLAEQAYEFEADKPINIIKFDYDVIENGEMVGADFLLNDLDTLEQDMITNQTVNQQQVRYVISLAREFPEAFNDLRINGSTIFALPLEKLERRFPGLFNIRIGNIDITPVALMDPTRFSLELTNMGYNQVRLNRGFQGDSSSSSVQSWNTDIDGIWPVKLSVCGPDTVVLSGMSRQDRDSVFSFITSNQRSPFENLGAASAWRIDMSMEENQVVPDSLADIIITLNLSGYYDAALKKEIESKPTPSRILTQWFSARRNFPDSFYELNHNAIMNWDISKNALSLKQKVGQLRNIGFMLSTDPGRPQFNSLTSTYEFEFTITPGGALEYEIPHINLSQNNLTLDAEASVYKVDALSAGWEFSWNFGDDTGWLSGSPLQHTYTKPGRYTVVLRTVKGGKLLEYTMWVTVSRKYKLTGPLTVYPSLKITGKEGEFFKITAKPIIPTKLVSTEIALDSIWSANRKILELDSASQFKLETGKYKLSFTAVRDLNARIYSKQCYFPGKTVSIKLLTAASNQYAKDKAGNTQPPNELCRHIFASGPITPDDKWTLELKPEDNEFLRSVTTNDIQKVDLDIVNDIVLSMEYEEN
ncbi:MAG TPA: PKD domain-containing protein, partial [Clostridia bacterium]|nr:PKD domain-containing protein [Clostridia bacterium]